MGGLLLDIHQLKNMFLLHTYPQVDSRRQIKLWHLTISSWDANLWNLSMRPEASKLACAAPSEQLAIILASTFLELISDFQSRSPLSKRWVSLGRERGVGRKRAHQFAEALIDVCQNPVVSSTCIWLNPTDLEALWPYTCNVLSSTANTRGASSYTTPRTAPLKHEMKHEIDRETWHPCECWANHESSVNRNNSQDWQHAAAPHSSLIGMFTWSLVGLRHPPYISHLLPP